MALLNEINVKGVPHPIVTDDGYYSEMSVGDAEQLISTQFVEDSEPYLFRPTGGSSDVGNRAYLDKIVGGAVAWNQIFENKRTNSFGVTITNNSDGSMTLNGATTKTYFNIDPISSENFIGHKYMLVLNIIDNPDNVEFSYGHINQPFAITPKAIRGIQGLIYSQNITRGKSRGFTGFSIGTVFNNVRVCIMEHDLTQMFGSTIADYIYSLEQSQAGAGVAWFKKLFPKDYYEYNAGELLSVEGLQSHDTVGFNQWDEEWEVGDIEASYGKPIVNASCWRSKNFIKIVPSSSYYAYSPTSKGRHSIRARFYDANQQFIGILDKNGGAVYTEQPFIVPDNAHYMKFAPFNSEVPTHDICINLSSPSRNGEYEPYEKHSYPLDNSITLRGIPKLDASNNLYYDGDEYASDGTVTRKYGVVDLGGLNWEQNATSRFYAILPNKASIKPSYDDYTNVMCANYESKTLNEIFASNKGISTHPLTGENVWIYDSDYTDGNALKQALQGVMLVYELATPITETAEPYNEIQICDDFGTEEFVSTGIVPVGHNTRYPANLRDKLQHLPSLASADGTYLIQQSGKQMSLIHMPAVFPETPTEDGAYVLKATVSGGTPTYVWEDVNAESGVNNYDYTV